MSVFSALLILYTWTRAFELHLEAR